MEFDDIVIGSGLAALGVVLGLPVRRRVLVIGGPMPGHSSYYDASRTVPCAHLGHGGLGQFWHGVIPTAGRANFANSTPDAFTHLFRHFYPRTDPAHRLGMPWLFVPWRPIRPPAEWRRLRAQRGGHLIFIHEIAARFDIETGGVAVHLKNERHRARRVWLCAGPLHTPALLERSLQTALARRFISDHVICYLGQIDRTSHPEVTAPRVERTADGVWFEGRFNADATGLCTLRPARFAFARLDHGIEQRATFGLPTGGAIQKIVRAASLGLLAEALFNRAGCFPRARMQSAYAQILAPDAYLLQNGDGQLSLRRDVIQAAIDAVRASAPWSQLDPSRRPEMFLPGIHLHHSLDLSLLAKTGLNSPGAPVQIADASIYEHIGPEHHTFKMMVAAAERARQHGEK